jgi:hypothetical protein
MKNFVKPVEAVTRCHHLGAPDALPKRFFWSVDLSFGDLLKCPVNFFVQGTPFIQLRIALSCHELQSYRPRYAPVVASTKTDHSAPETDSPQNTRHAGFGKRFVASSMKFTCGFGLGFFM